MDPTQALYNADEAVKHGYFAGAVDGLNNYYKWRLKGGFMPESMRGGLNGDEYADKLAKRLCEKLA